MIVVLNIVDDADITKAALKGIFSKEDRVAAIVAAAYMDDYLEELLRLWINGRRMVHLAVGEDKRRLGKLVNELLKTDSPLGSFSARISMSFVLGIIGPIMHKDLVCIKEIRNKFAHRVTVADKSGKPVHVTFDTQQIADWCKNLKFLSHFGAKPSKPVTPKEIFCANAVTII
jgi:hypothetical protein